MIGHIFDAFIEKQETMIKNGSIDTQSRSAEKKAKNWCQSP